MFQLISEQIKMDDAIGDSKPDSFASFSDEWKQEIERRVAELDAGTAMTVPWSKVKNEALARIDSKAVGEWKGRTVFKLKDVQHLEFPYW